VENAKKQGDAFWKWFTKAYAVPVGHEPKSNSEWGLVKYMAMRDADQNGWNWQMDADEG
jgi:hypothetical protein